MSESFKRYEKKYLLDNRQYSLIKDFIKDYVVDDVYKEYNLMSIYYDNDNYELIRRSIEKPKYKEKLRIRAYNPPNKDDYIQVELKKKFDGIVYKRRTQGQYEDVLNNIYTCEFKDLQVGKEINYFLDYYGQLKPKIYIACKRRSYKGKEDESLRITFDENMTYRFKNICLKEDRENDKSINDGIIMEIKVNESMPLWLTKMLDEAKAYPKSFSKVGNAYLKEMENNNGII